MDLCARDFVPLPYDQRLTLAGVTYVCRAIHHPGLRDRLPFVSRLRGVAQRVAVELAIRWWLQAEHIPYALLASEPLTEPQRRHLVVGGRLLHVACHTVTSPRQIQRLRKDPSPLRQAEALIPAKSLMGDHIGPGDLCLFTYLLCRETRTRAEVQKALSARLQTHLLTLPRRGEWRQQRHWRTLGPLTITNPNRQPLAIELAGELQDRKLYIQPFTVPPEQSRTLTARLHTLLYVRAVEPCTPSLRITSAAIDQPWIITSSDWDNLWFYGSHILLAGWMTLGEFQQQSMRGGAGARSRFTGPIASDHRWVRVANLRPLADLLKRLRTG